MTYRPPSARPGGPPSRSEAARRALQGAQQALEAALRCLEAQGAAELLGDAQGQHRALQGASHLTATASVHLHRAMAEVDRG